MRCVAHDGSSELWGDKRDGCGCYAVAWRGCGPAGTTGSERRRLRSSADRDAAQRRHAETMAERAAATEVRRKRARSLTPDRESDGEEGVMMWVIDGWGEGGW